MKKSYKILSLLIIVLYTNSASCHLPDLGSDHRATLSVHDEKIIGNKWMRELYGAGMVYTDPLVNEYIQHLGNRLTPFMTAPYHDLKIKFFVVNDTSINAFAFFGGHVGVHSGLIAIAQSENELAGVMAHELGHIAQQHILRQITENQRMYPLMLAGSLAAVVLGVPDLIIPVIAGHGQHMLNFGRQHEQEADRIGMQILAQASFDPNGLPNMFERMGTSHRYENKPPEYLLSHPLYESRIADTRHRASTLVYVKKPSSNMFPLIKERINVQNSKQLNTLISEYQHKLNTKRYNNELAVQYGYAYALQQNGKPEQAWQAIQPLLNQYPDDVIIQSTAASIELDLQNTKAAQQRLEKLLNIHPDSSAISLNYIDFYVQTKQPKVARKLLTKYKAIHKSDPAYYELCRQTESMLGNHTGVLEANAEWYVLNGDLNSAKDQLEIALNNKQLDQKTISRLKSRIKEISDFQDELKTL